jgi:hypothetical protein
VKADCSVWNTAKSFEIYWPLLLKSTFRLGQSGKNEGLTLTGTGWKPLSSAKFYGADYDLRLEGKIV